MKLLGAYELGDLIEVFFNISSREYNGRYYHNIDAWKISNPNEEEKSEKTKEENLPF